MRLPSPVLSVVLLAAIACQAPPQDSAGAARNGQPKLTRFREGPNGFAQYSGYTEPTRLVIRDSEAWARAWATLHATAATPPPLPAVDFQREAVVLVASGTRSTGGHDLTLTSAAADGDTVRITGRLARPGAGCMATTALTQPVDIARLEPPPAAVAFDLRDEAVDCGN